MFRIIDNKKIEMTNDEWKMYESICSSHEPLGKSLFVNMFEVNDEGLIQYLIPPQKKFAIDVVLFLQNLMLHQHLRKVYKEHDEALVELKLVIDQSKKYSKDVEDLKMELKEVTKQLKELQASSERKK